MLWLNPRALSYARVRFDRVGCIVDLYLLYIVHGVSKAQIIQYRQVSQSYGCYNVATRLRRNHRVSCHLSAAHLT
jgi:hypothetical protein